MCLLSTRSSKPRRRRDLYYYGEICWLDLSRVAVSFAHVNCKLEIQSVLVAFSPWSGWVLPECQLLTEGRLLDYEDIFTALLKRGSMLRELVWCLAHLFLSPEAQGRLLFDALFGFIPDF